MNADGRLDLVTIATGAVSYRLGGAAMFGPAVRIGSVVQGQALAVADADKDGDLDVYGLTGDLPGRSNPVDVLLRNTGGLRFTSLAMPAATGLGDDVTVLHASRALRLQFLVLNGREDARGNLQLLRLRG